MTIFIGNLALETTEAELRGMFLPFGAVSTVTMMNDNYIGSGQTRGYSFVEMPVQAEGEFAIRGLNGKTFKGRNMSVVQSMPIEQTPVRRPSSRIRQRN